MKPLPDCATAFRHIALDCVARLRLHHAGACAGDAEAVHQIRVAITRLRAAVSFFAPIAADEEWRRLKQEIAWLNAALGAARDSDVIAEYARRERYRAWARSMIGDAIQVQQARHRRRMVRCLGSRRFRTLVDAISQWIESGPWLQRWKRKATRAMPLKAYCESELDRWRRRLIRTGRRLKTLDASDRHRLRIRAKRFRYMLEALSSLVPVFEPADIVRVHKPAKRLQQTLGDLRDLKRFADTARPARTDRPGKMRPPGYRRQRRQLRKAAMAAYRRLEEAGAC